jgi:uncharacterized repeat protein (TIGR02543 family)
VKFDVVRTKKSAARSKIISALITVLISGLLVSIPIPANAAACVPTSTTVSGETVLTFTTVGSCDLTLPTAVTSVRVLVVGGGGSGAGGISGSWFGAGGGGGAVVENQTFTVTPDVAIPVTVGAGGIKSLYNTTYTSANFDLRSGSSSVFGSITAGGGKSAINSTPAGGVSGNGNAGGIATPKVYPWGYGGAGAGEPGNEKSPGAGVISNISGTSLEYGGGGNGNSGSPAANPRPGAGSQGVAALANRGGGGSQMPSDSYNGGAGGSGVVIVRFIAQPITISYDGNGNTGGSAPGNTTVNAFASTSLATNSGTLVITNYTFSGWNTAANGSGTSYASGATGVSVNNNTTLYAQWNSTITYNANGATGGSAPASTTAFGSGANTTLATPATT